MKWGGPKLRPIPVSLQIGPGKGIGVPISANTMHAPLAKLQARDCLLFSSSSQKSAACQSHKQPYMSMHVCTHNLGNSPPFHIWKLLLMNFSVSMVKCMC